MILKKVLRVFGKAQRPVAWTIFVLSLVAFVSIVSSLWSVQDPVNAGLSSLILVYEGFQAVSAVENELDSEGAVS